MNPSESDIQRIVEQEIARQTVVSSTGVNPVCGCPTGAGEPGIYDGFITAIRLERELKVQVGQTLILTPNAKLTPAAKDLIKDKKLQVERREAQATLPKLSTQWAWWLDGACPTCEGVMKHFTARSLPVLVDRRPANLLSCLLDVRSKMKAGSICGAILFVRSAAQASVLANAAPEIRAVVGTTPRAVESGIKKAGANVLLIEYPLFGAEGLMGLVRQMMDTVKPTIDPLSDAIQQLTGGLK